MQLQMIKEKVNKVSVCLSCESCYILNFISTKLRFFFKSISVIRCVGICAFQLFLFCYLSLQICRNVWICYREITLNWSNDVHPLLPQPPSVSSPNSCAQSLCVQRMLHLSLHILTFYLGYVVLLLITRKKKPQVECCFVKSSVIFKLSNS